MRIELLNEFVVYARYGNIDKAASKLCMTYSLLSKHISAMEKELGFALIGQTRPVKLTSEGILFLQYAQEVLDKYNEGVARCRESAQSKPVRLQWLNYTNHYDELLAQVQDIPLTHVAVEARESYLYGLEADLSDVIATNDISSDDSLMAEAEAEGISVLPTGRDEFSIIVSRLNPLAGLPALNSEDLEGAEVVISTGPCFDSWKDGVSSAFVNVENIRFLYKPREYVDEEDLRSGVFVEPKSRMPQVPIVFNNPEDFTSFDELDGSPITIKSCLLYKSTPSTNYNVRRFIERAKEYYADDVPNSDESLAI